MIRGRHGSIEVLPRTRSCTVYLSLIMADRFPTLDSCFFSSVNYARLQILSSSVVNDVLILQLGGVQKTQIFSGEFESTFSSDNRICVSLLSEPRGDLLCPADPREINFTPDLQPNDGDQLNSTTSEEIWVHVYEQH